MEEGLETTEVEKCRMAAGRAKPEEKQQQQLEEEQQQQEEAGNNNGCQRQERRIQANKPSTSMLGNPLLHHRLLLVVGRGGCPLQWCGKASCSARSQSRSMHGTQEEAAAAAAAAAAVRVSAAAAAAAVVVVRGKNIITICSSNSSLLFSFKRRPKG